MSKKPKRHGLTPRQRRFVSAYLVSLNGSEAVRKAGYKGGQPDVAAQWYLTHPKVKSSISERLSAILGAEADTIRHRVIAELKKEAFETDTIITMQTGDTSSDRYNPAKMKALELLAKYGGLLTDKIEITGKDGQPLKVEYEQLPATAKE